MAHSEKPLSYMLEDLSWIPKTENSGCGNASNPYSGRTDMEIFLAGQPYSPNQSAPGQLQILAQKK